MKKENPAISAATRRYYLGFNAFGKIGPISLRRLECYFLDLAKAWRASHQELEQTGLANKLIEEFIVWRQSHDINKIEEELVNQKISYIIWKDQVYPQLLHEIPAPPPILYYQGELESLNLNLLSIVGARKHSAYAEKIIKNFIPTVVQAGIGTVSGLALGIDTLVHQHTINNYGRTIAILGSGLKNIYPRGNWRLAQEIITAGGLILSEFFPSTPPYKQNFPQRNRIISGISPATLIVEAPKKSGAIITANYALEQNREVLSIPGNIFSEFSSGCNELIKHGAKTITDPADILETFGLTISKSNFISQENKEYQTTNAHEKLVYELIKRASQRSEKISANEIIEITKLDTATINSTLSILEIAGIVKNTEFGYDLN